MANGSSGRTSRRRFVATAGIAGIAALSGCFGGGDALESAAGDDDPATDGTPGDDDTRSDAGSDGSPEGVPTTDRSLPRHYENAELEEEMLSGGPGKDGIPSIDDPTFTAADEPPSNLAADDPVFGVVTNGEAKAYPQYVLVWHEIVNDVVGGESVAVTYCPLTGTAQGFYRGDVEFGVSGKLINSNLAMYDRATDGLWPQMLARSIDGPHEGAHLEEFQVIWTTWERWREQYPDTDVLTEDTEYIRNYGDDPYGQYNPRSGYYANNDILFSPLTTSDRFPPKYVVIGSRTADGAMAVPKATLRDEGVLEATTGGVPYVTVYDGSLDTGYVYRNPDDASVEYGSGTVTVDGTEYAADSLPLERAIGFDAMWFAWHGYYPTSAVHDCCRRACILLERPCSGDR